MGCAWTPSPEKLRDMRGRGRKSYLGIRAAGAGVGAGMEKGGAGVGGVAAHLRSGAARRARGTTEQRDAHRRSETGETGDGKVDFHRDFRWFFGGEWG